MTRAPRVLGLMSGTSADGVDAALLELPGWPELGTGAAFPALTGRAPRGRVVAHEFTPYTPDLRAAVLSAMRGEAHAADLTQLHWWLGEVYAQAAAPLAADADLVATHGQTVQHHPRPDRARGWARPATLQLGEAAVLAEATGKSVVADFRPADIAAGGVGAAAVELGKAMGARVVAAALSERPLVTMVRLTDPPALVHDRHTCCLIRLGSDKTECASCPRLSEGERRVRQRLRHTPAPARAGSSTR